MRAAGAHRGRSRAIDYAVIWTLTVAALTYALIGASHAEDEPVDVETVVAAVPVHSEADGLTNVPGYGGVEVIEGLDYNVLESHDACDQLTLIVTLSVAEGYELAYEPEGGYSASLPDFDEVKDPGAGWAFAVGEHEACTPGTNVPDDSEKPKPEAGPLPATGSQIGATEYTMLVIGIALIVGGLLIERRQATPARHRR